MRHLAWLHAIPDHHSEPRYNLLEPKDARRSLPPISSHSHLIEMVNDLGLCRYGNQETRVKDDKTYSYRGVTPVDFQEINAWQSSCGVSLSPWELETLRMLSDAYVIQLGKSRDEGCGAPFDDRDMESVRQHVNGQFQRLYKQIGGGNG